MGEMVLTESGFDSRKTVCGSGKINLRATGFCKGKSICDGWAFPVLIPRKKDAMNNRMKIRMVVKMTANPFTKNEILLVTDNCLKCFQ